MQYAAPLAQDEDELKSEIAFPLDVVTDYVVSFYWIQLHLNNTDTQQLVQERCKMLQRLCMIGSQYRKTLGIILHANRNFC